MKYICTKNEMGLLELFTFPPMIDHDAMAEVLGRIKNHTRGDWRWVPREPISAGFISSDGTCYGESVTLNLKARSEEDTKLLAVQMSMSGQ